MKITSLKNKSVILFRCHYLNKDLINEFQKIKNSCEDNFDVILSYDNTRNDIKIISEYKYHIFDMNDIKKLNYHLYENPIWHNPEYALLEFYLKNPYYKYYWIVEYDVRFTGDWNLFFESFLELDIDLICLYFKKYPTNPNWACWNVTNLKINNNQKLGMFFPVCRLSNRSLKLLDKKYKSGIFGHCELIVPTLISREGYKIQDIGKKFYNLNTFSHKPIRNSAGKELNKLYHPVKTKQ